MAKSKRMIISGPMDAKHVGGINVTGDSKPSVLDSYFSNDALEPDQLPSHTFTAAGKVEVPRRSITIASTIRRPDLSLRKSFSKLRRTSISHLPNLHGTSESKNKADMTIERSESTNTRSSGRPLRMQSSMSRLRQRVGLDKDLYDPITVSKPVTPEPEAAPEAMQKDYFPLPARKPLSKAMSYSSLRRLEPEIPSAHPPMQRRPSFPQQHVSTIQRKPSPALHRPSTASMTTVVTKQLPVRPKRADSGTAIDFDNVPVQERPLPFREIMVVQSFAERMAMYKKTRDYWACADHGLIEWTGRAGGPRTALRQV